MEVEGVMAADMVEEALEVWWVKQQELLVLEVVMEVEGVMAADMEVVDHLEDTLPQQRLVILDTPRMEETMAIQETILHPLETTLLPRKAIILPKETILPHLSK